MLKYTRIFGGCLGAVTDLCRHQYVYKYISVYYTFWFRNLRLLGEAMVCESVRNSQVHTHTNRVVSSVLTYMSLRYNKCIHFDYDFLCICILRTYIKIYARVWSWHIARLASRGIYYYIIFLLYICEVLFEFTAEIAFLIKVSILSQVVSISNCLNRLKHILCIYVYVFEVSTI